MKKKLLLVIIMAIISISIGCSSAPDAAQIKSDLLGHVLTGTTWTFSALSEYEQFTIISKQKQGDALEYTISMRLQDLASGQHFLADVVVVYIDYGKNWGLSTIVTKLFTRVQ